MGGKQLRLFLVDGTPGGLTTAQIMNWTGQVLSGRRSDLADLLRRPEAQRPGVYLLLGDDETAIGGIRCYVGEAEDVADRLRNHQRNKEFWDRVVVITSTDENLTKGHIRYLEARLIELATRAARVELENGTQPPRAPLPEADRSDMDYFVDQLHVILPVLGINAIRVREQQPLVATAAADQVSPIFRLTHSKLGVVAASLPRATSGRRRSPPEPSGCTPSAVGRSRLPGRRQRSSPGTARCRRCAPGMVRPQRADP